MIIQEYIKLCLDELRQDGKDFSYDAEEALETVCLLCEYPAGHIHPQISEGDENCPSVVYSTRDLKRSLTIDIDEKGREIYIYKTDSENGAVLIHCGSVSLRMLRSAFQWLHEGKTL